MSAPLPPEALSRHEFPRAVLEVLAGLGQAGHRAFLVGGSVRDILLGKRAKDYDIATSARAEEVLTLFRRVIPTGLKHGTVTVVSRGMSLEVTTFRAEAGYSDGRRPDTVHFIEDIAADLARRDFTVNAMAFDPVTGVFVDPFGGQTDLEARTIRCVGAPELRFSEDGLRPLRAVRFASTLGFEIEPATLAAIPPTLATFDKIAGERVREELSKLLVGPTPSRGLEWLRATGLLARILPVWGVPSEAWAPTLGRVDALPPVLELRLAGLLLSPFGMLPAESRPRASERALERLRLSRASLDTIALLLREAELVRAPSGTPALLRRHLSRIGRDRLAPVLELARVIDPEAARSLETRMAAVLAENPPLTLGELALKGEEIGELLGTGPGRQVGEALKALLEAVLEDPERNTPATLRGWLRSR